MQLFLPEIVGLVAEPCGLIKVLGIECSLLLFPYLFEFAQQRCLSLQHRRHTAYHETQCSATVCRALCAVDMQRACYIHANMQHACMEDAGMEDEWNIDETYMQHTCNIYETHATYMQHSSLSHVQLVHKHLELGRLLEQ